MRGLTLSDPAFVGAAVGFSPLDLSPALWLDASDTSTITASSGKVSLWNDKSINGRNVSQATSSNQPTTGATTKNGKNVIDFNGTSTYFLTSAWSGNIQTAFVVSYVNTTSAFKTMVGAQQANIIGQAGNSDAYYFQYGNPARTPRIAAGVPFTTTDVGVTVSAVSNQTWNVTVGQINYLTGDFYLENNNGTATTVNYTQALKTYSGNVTVGAGYYNRSVTDYFSGSIAEVVLFTTVLTATQITSMRTYLNAKWAVY